MNAPHRHSTASMVAVSLLLASGDASADGEAGVLIPVALLALTAGGVAGSLARYSKASTAVFAIPFAAYVLLSLLAAGVWASSSEDFVFVAAYAALVGILPYSVAYFVLRRIGHSLRRRHRRRARVRKEPSSPHAQKDPASP